MVAETVGHGFPDTLHPLSCLGPQMSPATDSRAQGHCSATLLSPTPALLRPHLLSRQTGKVSVLDAKVKKRHPGSCDC